MDSKLGAPKAGDALTLLVKLPIDVDRCGCGACSSVTEPDDEEAEGMTATSWSAFSGSGATCEDLRRMVLVDPKPALLWRR